jgi:hypothetical protein
MKSRAKLSKQFSSARSAFYWPRYYSKQGCVIRSESFGTDYSAACTKAASFNARFDANGAPLGMMSLLPD